MSRRLLNLRNVPEDEAMDVRALLREHGIEYYETPPARWGISMGSIWLARDADYKRARDLFAEYQTQRAERARSIYLARKRAGEVETFAIVFRRNPLQVLIYLLGAIGLIVLMMWPVWLLMNS